jgi:hypothetical protein
MDADQWPDDLRISDIEERLVEIAQRVCVFGTFE